MKFVIEYDCNRNPIYWLRHLLFTLERPRGCHFTSWHNDQSFEYDLNHQNMLELQVLSDLKRPLEEVRSKLICTMAVALLTGYEMEVFWSERSIALMDGLIELNGFTEGYVIDLIREFTDALKLVG